jgi:nucleoside phosphorylase
VYAVVGVDVLVVAAFPPELAPLREALGTDLRRRVAGLDVAAKAVGIGLATAAAGAAGRIALLQPRAVVMVGTCGTYDGVHPIGAVGVARRIVLADSAALRGDAAFPDPMSTEVAADRAMAGGLVANGGTAADIATTLAITTDDALATAIAAGTRCSLEHLEAYGVAAACAAEAVPFVAALGVANVVGSRAREEWKRHHRAASDAAIRVLLAWFTSGAPGLARA